MEVSGHAAGWTALATPRAGQTEGWPRRQFVPSISFLFLQRCLKTSTRARREYLTWNVDFNPPHRICDTVAKLVNEPVGPNDRQRPPLDQRLKHHAANTHGVIGGKIDPFGIQNQQREHNGPQKPTAGTALPDS